MSKPTTQFQVRWSPSLRNRIEKLAEMSDKSLHAQVITMLESYIRDIDDETVVYLRDGLTSADIKKIEEAAEQRMISFAAEVTSRLSESFDPSTVLDEVTLTRIVDTVIEKTEKRFKQKYGLEAEED